MLPNELLTTHNLSPIFFPLLCFPFALYSSVFSISGLCTVSSSQLCNKWRSCSEVSNYEYPVHPWDTLEHRKGAKGNFHGYYRLEHPDEYISFCCFPIILPQIRLCLDWKQNKKEQQGYICSVNCFKDFTLELCKPVLLSSYF